MIDVELLTETYLILKQYIPEKDRQEAADNLMSEMIDLLNDEELEVLGDTDSFLKHALKEYAHQDDDDDYEEEY